MRCPLARFQPLWRDRSRINRGRSIPVHRLEAVFREWREAGIDPARVLNAAVRDGLLDDATKLQVMLALTRLGYADTQKNR